MASRDPFPMSSVQAQKLHASVEGGSQLSDWNNMRTSSHHKGPSDSAVERSENEAQESLKGSSGAIAKNDDDIYADIDKPEKPDDDFLDTPLNELRGSPVERFFFLSHQILPQAICESLWQPLASGGNDAYPLSCNDTFLHDWRLLAPPQPQGPHFDISLWCCRHSEG